MTTAAPSSSSVAAAASAAPVVASGLTKVIDERPILRGIDLRIEAGEYVALLGSNGAGKSTLLRVLATLTPPTSGDLRLFGQAPHQHGARIRARMGLIAHQPMLYDDLTARENLEFFGTLYGLPSPAKRAKEMLALVGLENRGDDPIKAFSRGMAQRIAIARALLHEPEMILADEPFAGLDDRSSGALEGLLARLHEQGRTIILVNHAIEQTLRLAQRAIVLCGGRMVLDRPTASLTTTEVLAEMTQP